jgi:crotonobetainyl-CoA:carnitine CoA-transferase CaiB-like acyl-CoA transferase
MIPDLPGVSILLTSKIQKLGKVVVECSSYIPSDTPGKIARAAPALGDDTIYVLENLLGYRRARIEELKARSVLQ